MNHHLRRWAPLLALGLAACAGEAVAPTESTGSTSGVGATGSLSSGATGGVASGSSSNSTASSSASSSSSGTSSASSSSSSGSSGSTASSSSASSNSSASNSSASSSSSSSGGSSGTPDAGPLPDPCVSAPAPACPNPAAPEGGGLVALDRCAFSIHENGTFTSAPPLIAALETLAPRVGVADVLGDLNRTGTSTTSVPGNPSGVSFAFNWQSDDEATTTWTPQGISGSPDATATGLVSGKRVVLVSWYAEPPAGSMDKGVRIAFVDTTHTNAITYRFALLVVPGGTAAAPTFSALNLHAGGIVWFGDLLYVADTNHGFRVFDLTHILRVQTDVDDIGCAAGVCRAGTYKYAIPQIGSYSTASGCAPLFSFVSLDRASTPPALVSGEYCSSTACAGPLTGRVLRWPLDETSGKLAASTTWPEAAYAMGQRQIQGAAVNGATWLLSSSAPSGNGGDLYRVKVGRAATSGWIDNPEDLMVDPGHGLLYGLSERATARTVTVVQLASYPAP